MKKLLSKLWHKSFYMTGIGIAAVTGGLFSAHVQAAIPSTATNAITGCYDKTGGAARIIDAEDSATCTSSENTVTWPASAPQIAYLQLNSDATIDTAYSKNIESVTLVPDADHVNYAACIKVSFDPKVGLSDDMQGGATVKSVRGGDDTLTGVCGSSTLYNAVIKYVGQYDYPDPDYSYVRATFFN